MTEFRLLEEQSPRRIDLGEWALRLAVAALFVMFGWDKFPSDPHSEGVRIFEQIGLGPWFRYFTGVVEVGGGLLVLVPSTAFAGFATLAVTMLGAVLAHLFALHDGFFAFLPASLCAALTLIAIQRWAR
jgi:uncharacterized membrane protein YphA (DoxX/SURF4 family)